MFGLMVMLMIGCGETTEPAAEAPPVEQPKAAKDPAPAPAEEVTPAEVAPALLNPQAAKETAPDLYKVKFETTEGDVVLTVHREWSPKGADRFYNLVQIGYFTDIAFFRVIDGCMTQFGIHGDPRVSKAWENASITDDPVVKSNHRGMVSFATSGPNTRTTQMFINVADNARLDPMGFSAFAEVTEGMEVVDKLYSGYGEGAPRGRGPFQGRIQSHGNAYLKADFPELDYLKSASIVD